MRIYIPICRVKSVTRKALNPGSGYMLLSRHGSICVQMARHDNLTDYYTLMIGQLIYAYGFSASMSMIQHFIHIWLIYVDVQQVIIFMISA